MGRKIAMDITSHAALFAGHKKMAKKVFDVVAITGEYTNAQGETKAVHELRCRI